MSVDRDPSQFIESLRRGSLAASVQVVGMVQAADENSDSIQLTRDCSMWVSIPASMIEEIRLLGTQKCKDHMHYVAGIRFKEPQTEEGTVFARLITEQLATPPITRGIGGGGDEEPPGAGSCHGCVHACYVQCGGYDRYDPWCFRECIRTWCPECG
nr:hypothetical protein GCM10017611_04620 [Rhodococcus wratislaviensis]